MVCALLNACLNQEVDINKDSNAEKLVLPYMCQFIVTKWNAGFSLEGRIDGGTARLPTKLFFFFFNVMSCNVH